MANEHKLSFTAADIEERLRKAGDAVLCTEQSLSPEQQAQARANIGATSVEDVLAALPIGEGVRY